jgi:hypothetical protein
MGLRKIGNGWPQIPGLRCASTWALESRPCGAQDRKKSGPLGPDTFLECESQFSVCGSWRERATCIPPEGFAGGKTFPAGKTNFFPAGWERFSWNRRGILSRRAERCQHWDGTLQFERTRRARCFHHKGTKKSRSPNLNLVSLVPSWFKNPRILELIRAATYALPGRSTISPTTTVTLSRPPWSKASLTSASQVA